MSNKMMLTLVVVANATLVACSSGTNSSGISNGPQSLLIAPVSGGGAVIQSRSSATTWVVGGGFPFRGVDIARAANGDRVLMRGSGSFSSGSISGGGKYTIENANGNIRGHGTFSATSFVSFVSYGFVAPTVEGGQLVAGVHMASASGGTADGTLTVTCKLGSPPPGVDEGINLSVNGTDYDKSIHGNTVFIKQ